MDRAWLAGTLWPDSPEAAALANLRSSLKDLRQALGPEAERLHSLGLSALSLDLTGAHADVIAFDAAIAQGETVALERAVALYRGPLLEACAEAWAFEERQAREQAYLTALESLAAHAIAGGDPSAAERHLRRAVAVDPLRESAQRALLQALAAGGNYALALQTHRELRLLLHRELNAAPDAATTALFEQLKAEAHRRAQARPLTPSIPAPARVASGVRSQAAEEEEVTRVIGAGSRQRTGAARVVLLYKHNVQPDEALLKLLETQLTARGFQLFVDRHLTIGLEWAWEIERQVRTADAVVPLLSAASIASEMLAYEVQIAHDAASTHPSGRSRQRGKPRLLPVRVNYTGALPEPLAAVLNPLQHALWEGPQDNERLVAELVSALESPAVPRPAMPRERLEPIGGAVPLDSAFYVVRPADEEFRAAIARQDSIVLIKGARQMGKTSLLARGLQQARQAGARVVRTDFQMLNAVHLETADALLLKLADSIADQLDLDVPPEEIWHPRRGPSENFKRYWQRVALHAIAAPVVWGLDEVDRLFHCDFASEVFGLFRSWHNERALDPEGPWSRLTLAIAYATEAHLFIADVHQSPFNVGTQLTLQDFTFEQLADLNERYGSPLQGEAELARCARLVGGQPYLMCRGLHHMVTHDLSFPALEHQADRDEGIFGDHLRRMLVLLARDPDLCEAVRGVLRGQPCPTADSFYRLRTAGVVVGHSAQEVRLRCQLYATYLERHLL